MVGLFAPEKSRATNQRALHCFTAPETLLLKNYQHAAGCIATGISMDGTQIRWLHLHEDMHLISELNDKKEMFLADSGAEHFRQRDQQVQRLEMLKNRYINKITFQSDHFWDNSTSVGVVGSDSSVELLGIQQVTLIVKTGLWSRQSRTQRVVLAYER